MNTPSLVKTPALVHDTSPGAKCCYWSRSNDGNYALRPFREGDLLLRSLGNRGEDACSAPVRYLAGSRPGIHNRDGHAFLVPQWVPLTDPTDRTPAPTEFRQLAAELAGRMDKNRETEASWQITRQLVRLYEQARGVRSTYKATGPRALLSVRPRAASFPFDDHGQMFSGPKGLVWTSQPYHFDPAELLGFAAWHGLMVTVSASWSWHYPGRTSLIEWRPAAGDRAALP